MLRNPVAQHIENSVSSSSADDEFFVTGFLRIVKTQKDKTEIMAIKDILSEATFIILVSREFLWSFQGLALILILSYWHYSTYS